MKKGYFQHSNYRVTTKPQGWKVIRELDDFSWLSQRIMNEFPDLGVSKTIHLDLSSYFLQREPSIDLTSKSRIALSVQWKNKRGH